MPARYGILICHGTLFDKTEHVQKRAFRIIYPERGYDDCLSIAQCPQLKDRRQILWHKTFREIQEPSSLLHRLLPSSFVLERHA